MLLAHSMHWVPSTIAQLSQSGITVRVLDEKLRPVPWANIDVLAPDGSVVLVGEVANGKFEIADLGFGPHSLHIDKGTCAEVILKDIRFRMGKHFDLLAIRNSCQQTGDGFGSGCFVYLRIRGKSGAVTSAAASLEPYPYKFPADEYGRIEAAISANKRSTFRISADGYAPQLVTIECPQSARIEREIFLQP